MKKFFSNPCNRYFFLWTLFNLKGFLYQDGSIINQSILMLIMLISMYEIINFFKTIKTNSSTFFRSLNYIILMYTVYGLILLITDGTTVFSQYGDPYSSISFTASVWIILIPIYVTYLYTVQGYLRLNMLQKWMVVFVLTGIIQFYTFQHQMMTLFLEQGSNRTEAQNGAGYILLSIIPGMLVYKRKLFSYFGIAICIAFIIMAMKRGAILISAIALLLIIVRDFKTASNANKFAVFGLVLIGLVMLFNFVESMMETSDYFNARIEATLEGDSSGRDIIYQKYWNTYLYDSNFFQWAVGRGAMSTLKYGNIYAHNDWIEILFCHGFVGLLIFMNFWKRLFIESRSPYRSEPSRFCLFLLFSIFFLKSFFSMSIVGMPIYATTMMGFALADGFNEHCSYLRSK